MIGFVATLTLIEDVGEEWIASRFRRHIRTAWLVAGYILAILLFIRMLRLFGTTFTWTANAIRNGVLIFSAPRIKDKRVYLWLMGFVFLSYFPFWDMNLLATIGLALTLVAMLLINRYQGWVVKNKWTMSTTILLASVVLWTFDMLSYQYAFNETVIIGLVFMLVMYLAVLYAKMLGFQKRRIRELLYDTQHDALTGAYSVSKFNSDFTRFRVMSKAHRISPAHLVMIDIDHFKKVNDEYGHLVGNDLLKAFVKDFNDYLDELVYPTTLYRTGGEEFSLIVFGGVSDKQVYDLVTGYRKRLRDFAVETPNAYLKLTISAGITRIGDNVKQNEAIIKKADQNLYTAKRSGRDGVVTDDFSSFDAQKA